MALVTGTKPAAASASPAPVPQTTVLELALYTRYTWNGVTYEKGKPYRFLNEDALILMNERDTVSEEGSGRPIWKIYAPVRQRKTMAPAVVDATGVKAIKPVEDAKTIEGLPAPRKRIDIGDDSEIADILGAVGADGDEVTV